MGARFDALAVEFLEVLGLGMLILMGLTCLMVGAWFGWLISYQERCCSPSRFFLEGIVFPALTGALIASEFPFPNIKELIL